jgi:peptide/nickel transport system substrate-binding protein
MLKGLRWPLVVLLLASGLLFLALLTRPDEENSPSQSTATPTQPPPTPSDTALVTQTQPTPQPPLVTPTPVPPEHVLVEALVGDIRKLNPLLAMYNPVDRDITSLIFEGLTTTDDYGDIVPDLAQSWRVSSDGLEYVVMLRQDVLWQDGMPFTATDVVFTMDLMGDPRFPGPANLHNFWQTVEVDQLGDYVVRFRLTQPLASFTDQLRVGIVPEHVLRGVSVDQLDRHPFNLSPIGTGPYQIESLTSDGSGNLSGIILRSAPVYRQRPEGAQGFALDRVIFRTYPSADAALQAYQQGDVNAVGGIPTDLLASAQQFPDLSLYSAVAPRVGVLIYNWKRDDIRFVRNPRARQALAYSVDRTALVSDHLAGRAILADSPLLPGSWAYQPGNPWPTYDPTRAQELMTTANLVFDDEQAAPDATEEPAPAGTEEPVPDVTAEATELASEEATAQPLRMALTILVPDDPALVEMANTMAAGWQQIGVTGSVESVDLATLQSRLDAGDFDAALIELSFEPGADPDPYVFWHQGQYQTGQNYGGMDDRRISEALEQARRDPYAINRVVYYHQFQELFAERVPALVLYYPLYIYAADSRLDGVQLGFLSSPADRFRHIQDWSFDNE